MNNNPIHFHSFTIYAGIPFELVGHCHRSDNWRSSTDYTTSTMAEVMRELKIRLRMCVELEAQNNRKPVKRRVILYMLFDSDLSINIFRHASVVFSVIKRYPNTDILQTSLSNINHHTQQHHLCIVLIFHQWNLSQ